MNSKCNKLRLFFYILMTFIIIFILSYFAPYFNNNSLAFTFIAGIGMFFITTIIACLIDRQIIPWCWFRIKIYSNYDKSVQKIDECLEWLVRKNICDLVTLYIRDTIIKNDYNLIAHYGLSEPEPMYGPIVFDDFRKRLEKQKSEVFIKTIPDTERRKENVLGFRKRERIVSRSYFKLEENGIVEAALYFNWRNEQSFSDSQKETLRKYKDRIFAAVKKIKGVSTNRQQAIIDELSTRRWIDYSIMRNEYADNFQLLISKALYKFLDKIDSAELRIIIAKKSKVCFKLTNQSLQYLEFEGLPNDVISQLESIKNQEFRGRENFLNNLQLKIGDGQTVRYESRILKYAICFIKKEYGYSSEIGITPSNEPISEKEQDNYRWVFNSTRPKFINEQGSSRQIIVVPIKAPSQILANNQDESRKEDILGIIHVECTKGKLTREMVKPLCFLANHFGRIKEVSYTQREYDILKGNE